MMLALMLAVAAPDCHKALTQADMTSCAGADYLRADAALNAQWARTLRYMRDTDARSPVGSREQTYVAALLDAQRAWLKYRDVQCKLEGYAMRGGTAEPMVRSACLVDLTNARTKQLRDLMWNR